MAGYSGEGTADRSQCVPGVLNGRVKPGKENGLRWTGFVMLRSFGAHFVPIYVKN